MCSSISNLPTDYTTGISGTSDPPDPLKATIAADASAPGSALVSSALLLFVPPSHVTFTRDPTEGPRYLSKADPLAVGRRGRVVPIADT